jgi:hypothetical protein
MAQGPFLKRPPAHARYPRGAGAGAVNVQGNRTDRTDGWIPVGERLPDADTVVVVAISMRDRWSEPVWLGYLDGNDWRTVEGDVIHPTHWRELPEPPETLKAEKLKG